MKRVLWLVALVVLALAPAGALADKPGDMPIGVALSSADSQR
jgi:hypothetical protein